MNESQTRLLIQRELDGNLSKEEEVRLRRVLMVSDSAVSFRANLSQVVAVAKDLELPDDVRPSDSSQLAVEIIESLPVIKGNFWDPLFDIFAGRKSAEKDLRSTRSVGSSSQTSTASAKLKSVQQNSSAHHTAISNSGSRSVIDPAVLYPSKETVKEEEKKTPYGLPSVDQYLTGTHSAVGGLAKKLRKDFGNTQTEDVGKTLADAIREKVHESYHSSHEDEHHDERFDQAQTDAYEAFHGDEQNAQIAQRAVEIPVDNASGDSPLPEASQSFSPSFVLPVAPTLPEILPANITTQDLATSITLGSSMVLTVAPQGSGIKAMPQTPKLQPSASGHNFAEQEFVDWKSGAYPTVPPPVKPWSETQSETGPLAPFPISATKWTNQTPDAWTDWVPPPTPENPAPPADPWAPPMAPTPQTMQAPWAPNPVTAHMVPVQFQKSSQFVPIPIVPTPVIKLPVLPAPAPTPAPVPAPAPMPVEKPVHEEPSALKTSDEAVGYEPTIVPVTRNSLPIDALNERINQLFNEPAQAKPPTVVSQPPVAEPICKENNALENDLKECHSAIGRLADIRYSTNSPGHIKDLGRFLLTDETRASVGNTISKGLGHSHARVVSLEAAQQMAAVLEPVLQCPGVSGYMVCGYDGLTISSSFPGDVDIEMLGGCALVTFMNSHSIMKVLGHTRINQLILNTPGGCMLLADFGKGILVTLTNEMDAAMLAKLTETIEFVSSA
ncbi:MAG: hypothetical protein C0469_12230 [Cyanobacteria bacterium DS2.3.42]|nr:hypothetical protein [Cyanobacteria bacterium DS2.3.42]